MNDQVNIQHNKLMKLDDTILMYGILLYNILLPINHYIGNSTTICHSRSMSDNRELTETFHQNISSHYKVITSTF